MTGNILSQVRLDEIGKKKYEVGEHGILSELGLLDRREVVKLLFQFKNA